MNPNSKNQRWTKWVITATQTNRVIPFEVFKTNVAKFARKVFGSASVMDIEEGTLVWEVRVLSEGLASHDPTVVEYVKTLWTRFLREGLGPSTMVEVTAALKAGSREDGTPPDQLIIMPSLASLLEEPK